MLGFPRHACQAALTDVTKTSTQKVNYELHLNVLTTVAEKKSWTNLPTNEERLVHDADALQKRAVTPEALLKKNSDRI